MGDGRQTQSDTLIYDQRRDRTVWRGNVEYEDSDNRVSGPELTYLNETGNIIASNRAKFQLGEGQFLEADSTFREENNNRSVAIGGIIWQDTVEGIILYSPQLESKGEQVLTGGGRPLMVFHTSKGDSIFISADVIESQLDTQRVMVDTVTSRLDSSRTLLAVSKVRIWSADFSGRCDSLVYQEKDSLFRLYTDPVIWSDSSQISGDSIFLYLSDGQIDWMFSYGHAFMLEQVLGPIFQQVKSKTMEARFRQGQIQDLWARANAQMYYYVQDEADDFMGLQSSKSGEIQAVFDSTTAIQDIKWFSEIEGEIIPIKDVDPYTYRLEGFNWRGDEKPTQLEDLQVDGTLEKYYTGTVVPNESSREKDEDFKSLKAKKKVMQFILHYLFIIP
jgi:lipopolysaccharide export system protein LptA